MGCLPWCWLGSAAQVVAGQAGIPPSCLRSAKRHRAARALADCSVDLSSFPLGEEAWAVQGKPREGPLPYFPPHQFHLGGYYVELYPPCYQGDLYVGCYSSSYQMASLHSVFREMLDPICKEHPLNTELSPELYVVLLLCGLHPSCKKMSTSSIITSDQTRINLSVYILTLSDPPNIAIIVVHVVIAVYSSEPTRYVVIIITNQYVVIIDMPPWGGGVIIITLTA